MVFLRDEVCGLDLMMLVGELMDEVCGWGFGLLVCGSNLFMFVGVGQICSCLLVCGSNLVISGIIYITCK